MLETADRNDAIARSFPNALRKASAGSVSTSTSIAALARVTRPPVAWDATALAAAIRKREISSREAVAACVARMHEVNPRLNAVTVDLSEQALAHGRARRRRRRARRRRSGRCTACRSPSRRTSTRQAARPSTASSRSATSIARDDSPVVANWKKAGAIIIGRTNTPAFSFRLDTVNDLRGRTLQPVVARAHARAASSGGASSSVAAGITPLAHGNDIAGSVRYPAYLHGLAGLAAVVRPRAGVQSDRQGASARSPRS